MVEMSRGVGGRLADLRGPAHSEILCRGVWRGRAAEMGPQSLAECLQLDLQTAFADSTVVPKVMILTVISC